MAALDIINGLRLTTHCVANNKFKLFYLILAYMLADAFQIFF